MKVINGGLLLQKISLQFLISLQKIRFGENIKEVLIDNKKPNVNSEIIVFNINRFRDYHKYIVKNSNSCKCPFFNSPKNAKIVAKHNFNRGVTPL